MPFLKLCLITILALSFSAHAKKKCGSSELKEVIAKRGELAAAEEYGVVNNAGVYSPPTKCTPFMKAIQLISIKPAQGGRARFFGNDCNVYEWDSEGGKFEKYTSNSSFSTFHHQGEVWPVNGKDVGTAAHASRTNNNNITGIASIASMKDLCKIHSAGKLKASALEKSAVGQRIRCID